MKNEQPPPDTAIVKVVLAFFEKALDVLKPPLMKFFVVLIVTLLLAFVLVRNNINTQLGFVLVIMVIVLFAIITATLQYAEMRLHYTKLTEEELKRALRDTVTELQAEKKESQRQHTKKKKPRKKA